MATATMDAKTEILKASKKAQRGDLTRLAREYGVCNSTVTRWRLEAGFKKLQAGRPKGLAKNSVTRRNNILAGLKAGKTAVELAKKYGVTPTRIYQIRDYKG